MVGWKGAVGWFDLEQAVGRVAVVGSCVGRSWLERSCRWKEAGRLEERALFKEFGSCAEMDLTKIMSKAENESN